MFARLFGSSERAVLWVTRNHVKIDLTQNPERACESSLGKVRMWPKIKMIRKFGCVLMYLAGFALYEIFSIWSRK